MRRACSWGCVVSVLAVIALAAGLIFTFRAHLPASRTLFPSFGDTPPAVSFNVLSAAPTLLGFDAPKTYLLLFQNNTELRPSGGFIGSYAVVTLDRGSVRIETVQGIENLDTQADHARLPPPPRPLAEHLGVSYWFARDANWSPDFSVAARQFLDLYEQEGGHLAREIDAVVAMTPTAIERFLEITGAVTVEGIALTAENFTETLEYEVEYGYVHNGREFSERKQILLPLMNNLLDRVRGTLLTRSGAYRALAETLVREKHVVAYAPDSAIQSMVEAMGATGRLATPRGEYVLWVDANLGALKTDHAIKRHLTHRVAYRPETAADGLGAAVASTTMTYTHTGVFDWRTTRYRTYARVYVPAGATVLSATLHDRRGERVLQAEDIDAGEELGKQWFGAFVVIEPGQTGSVAFTYVLPETTTEMLKNGVYTLLVQKQVGTIAPQLTVDLDFGEGNQHHEETDLRVDRVFKRKM